MVFDSKILDKNQDGHTIRDRGSRCEMQGEFSLTSGVKYVGI